jgi:hypothetical protein
MTVAWSCYVRHSDGTRTKLHVEDDPDRPGWLRVMPDYTAREGDMLFWECRSGDLDLIGGVPVKPHDKLHTIYPGIRHPGAS